MFDPFITTYEESVAGPKEEIDKLASVQWSLVSMADDMGNIFEVSDTRRDSDNRLVLSIWHNAEGEREQAVATEKRVKANVARARVMFNKPDPRQQA